MGKILSPSLNISELILVQRWTFGHRQDEDYLDLYEYRVLGSHRFECDHWTFQFDGGQYARFRQVLKK